MKASIKKNYRTLTDLVKACQNNDPRAQTLFYNRFRSELIRICSRFARTHMEAEDIYQESFVKIFRHIHEVQNLESIESWMRSVVTRTAINYYHRTTKKETLNHSMDMSPMDFESNEHVCLIDSLSAGIVSDMIAQLPDGYKRIVNLHLIDGYSHIEIAQTLSITDSTSRSQLLRGRNLLMKKLRKCGIYGYEAP
ncbi:RNA polymerase sigma factor [Dyadobacter fermentans]|uniref:RNA polymerase, sigma-24 subunit, ECF subfamily n=1 Tax=Dyadobacter fermentans (strain ATCC 700827 / DSM 18053 / CIP 107007 / KCTC 52180 / NS114) TaxID=471854 RepID=C6W3C1_DYAFD|nr:RNA polymerase sigma factor [Dyadobacter fermentans]ACT92225.1 RNA polymerase, sigma-24 subunit, ECF subfamily [Dyadobacter fermentans DSM 18053]